MLRSVLYLQIITQSKLRVYFSNCLSELSSFEPISKEHIHCERMWHKIHDQILKYRYCKYPMPDYKKWLLTVTADTKFLRVL